MLYATTLLDRCRSVVAMNLARDGERTFWIEDGVTLVGRDLEVIRDRVELRVRHFEDGAGVDFHDASGSLRLQFREHLRADRLRRVWRRRPRGTEFSFRSLHHGFECEVGRLRAAFKFFQGDRGCDKAAGSGARGVWRNICLTAVSAQIVDKHSAGAGFLRRIDGEILRSLHRVGFCNGA